MKVDIHCSFKTAEPCLKSSKGTLSNISALHNLYPKYCSWLFVPPPAYSFIKLGKKSFCKTWFQVRDGAEKKYRNKEEMKERKKTTLHLQKYTPNVG